MRPVELRLSGLRSYRDLQVIDFSGVRLMAIIGDTGAGKSSLLEAICFALYGVCTWPVQGGGGGPLIAGSGEGVLRVEFTFRVRNETWKVTRTAAHGVTPPHHLKCLDTREEVDGSRKVTERICELVGFDAKTFLRAVMLPQGKFQELLQSSESERNALLKSVLDLGSLSEMRSRARSMADLLLPLLHETELRRGRLPLDPAGDLADASRRFAAASETLEQLDTVRDRVVGIRTLADEAGRRERDLRRAGERLSDKVRPGLYDDFAALIAVDALLAEDEDSLQQEIGQYESKIRELQGELDDAEERGIGVAATASALTVLNATAGQLPVWHTDRTNLEAERATIAESLAELDERARRLAGLVEKVAEAEEADQRASEDSEAATTAVTDCRSLLVDARNATHLAIEADNRVNGLRDNTKTLEDNVQALAEKHLEAQVALKTAQELLRAAHRADAAVHAAAGSSPGDPCPVCTRSLPESYEPPLGTDISAAEKAVEGATNACGTTEKAVRQAERKLDKAQGELEREIKAAELAAAARDDRLTAAGARLGAVDLEVADDVLLAELIGSAASAKSAAKTAAGALRAARTEHSGLRISIDTARPLIERQDQDARSSQVALRARWKTIEDSLRALPFYSGETITSADIEAAIGRVRAQEDTLGKIRTEHKELQTKVATSRQRWEKLGRQRTEQVDKPRASLSAELGVVVERASVVQAALSGETICCRKPEPTLSDDVAWAADTVAAAKSALEACALEANACEAKVVEMKRQIEFAYSIVEAEDDHHLERLIRSTNAKVETAKNERKAAERALPLCEELDRRLAAARPVWNGLDELVKLLADGKFVNSVVQRRQRTLLGTAGRIFESMTDGRFTFADKFKVIDMSTGHVRDVKTLSGGETFLASLALALALVEITSRGAGRVEALFLDEGFGTLDTNALHQALGELHRNAGEGRLVAVISHMRDVADNFESILMVKKSPKGSEAKWLSPEERDELMADDLASGLRS
jgi:exonuclease SbcC